MSFFLKTVMGSIQRGKCKCDTATVFVLLIAWGSSELCLNADISAEVIGIVLVKKIYQMPYLKTNL